MVLALPEVNANNDQSAPSLAASVPRVASDKRPRPGKDGHRGRFASRTTPEEVWHTAHGTSCGTMRVVMTASALTAREPRSLNPASGQGRLGGAMMGFPMAGTRT